MVVDAILDQLGVKDVVAVASVISGQPIIPTVGKFQGATRGTSLASSVFARNLNVRLLFRQTTLTGASLRTLRILFINNLGRIIGRTAPIVGWLIFGYDATQIIYRSVTWYNAMVSQKDRLW